MSGLPPIQAMAAGDHHILLLDKHGKVWGSGSNSSGQLGYAASKGFLDTPHLLPHGILSPIQAIAAKGHYSLLLDKNGCVWHSGKLGLHELDSTTFKRIENIPPIKAISVGLQHVLLLDVNGTPWVYGINNHGLLGNVAIIDTVRPLQVGGLPPIQAIATGDYFSLFLTESGSVSMCGSRLHIYNPANPEGIRNHFNTPTSVQGLPPDVPIRALFATGKWASFIDRNGTVWEGDWDKSPTFNAPVAKCAQKTLLASFFSKPKNILDNCRFTLRDFTLLALDSHPYTRLCLEKAYDLLHQEEFFSRLYFHLLLRQSPAYIYHTLDIIFLFDYRSFLL